MKRLIGIALVAGLVAGGCRPMGLPVPLEPPASTASTTTTTTLAGPSPTPGSDEVSPTTVPPVPDTDVDLTGLDDLLTELDDVLSNVDGAINKGEEQ